LRSPSERLTAKSPREEEEWLRGEREVWGILVAPSASAALSVDYHSYEWYTALMMRDVLTASQERLIRALSLRAQRGEPSPTYREICFELGWRSTGTVRDHLKVLARKGFVELANGRARLTRLKGAEYQGKAVPLVGKVAAGVPVSAEEVRGEMISVPSDWVGARVDFAVEVTGDSMEEADIVDGDLVLVRKQRTADDGKVVVVTLDGETTVKTLRKKGDRVSLVPENVRYKPIEIRSESAVVQGVVVGIVRRFPGGLSLRKRIGRR
jgi:repressor LexA